MSPKIDPEYENGKLLQVAIIKITEPKENKSIQRPIQGLDVSTPTDPGGSPPPPSASYAGSELVRYEPMEG